MGVVNSEGETPLDIAEEEAMEELLQNEINRQGDCIDILDRRRCINTTQMLGDTLNLDRIAVPKCDLSSVCNTFVQVW